MVSAVRDLKSILTPEDEEGRGLLMEPLTTVLNIQEVGTESQALAW